MGKKSCCAVESCGKKLGLLGFTCKCEQNFCPQHRHAEAHQCKFDYKETAKQQLLKYMSSPIVSPKLQAI